MNNDIFPFDAYCCGKKMTKTIQGDYVVFSCSQKNHSRFFRVSKNSNNTSYCSCGCGGSPMQTKDLGNARLYWGCHFCGARYNIVKNEVEVSVEITGSNSTDVSDVAIKSLSSIWDSRGGPFGEDIEGINQKKLEKVLKKICPEIESVNIEVSGMQNIVNIGTKTKVNKNTFASNGSDEKKSIKKERILINLVFPIIAGVLIGVILMFSFWSDIVEFIEQIWKTIFH